MSMLPAEIQVALHTEMDYLQIYLQNIQASRSMGPNSGLYKSSWALDTAILVKLKYSPADSNRDL